MIIYDKLWETMKTKGISQYYLITEHGFSRGQISRLKHGEHVSTKTLNNLCKILDCKLEDIVEYKAD